MVKAMRNKNLIAAFIIAAITVTAFSCKDTGTSPTTKPFKDPREMTWTVDTLAVPSWAIQVLPKDLLVVSPTDVWLAVWVGHGQIYHYDGKSWTMSLDLGGGIFCLTKGTSNDVWAGGYSNTIYLGHYDESNWIRVNDMDITGEIQSMCTDPSGNIWACGWNGLIMKYNKIQWVADTIKISGFNQNNCYLYSVRYYDGKIYVFAQNSENTRFAYISGNIKNWTVMDTFPLTSSTDVIKWGTLGSFNGISGKLYSYGLGGIWQLGSSGWNQVYDSDGAIRNISGPSENYLIGVGAYNRIMFYGGNTWQNISNYLKITDPNVAFNNVWTDGNEIFIAGYSMNAKTIIWHGK